MKKMLFFSAVVLVTLQAVSQKANVVLFTENGERFTVILNGARQNENPETQVKITDLTAEFYKLKIIFDDKSLGSLDKNLPLQLGSEVAYSIKKNNKGEYVLRFISETPVAQAPPPPPTQKVVVFNQEPAPAATSTTVVHQTTTTTSGGGPDQGQVNLGMSVNDPEMGVNFNFNMSAGGGGTQSQSTTTTTTTSSQSTSVQNVPAQPVQQVVYLPGYGGPVGCPRPMTPAEFGSVKNSVKSKSFEESKLTIAKQVINNNCLLSSQVKELMLLFSFEETRLDLAKYAYGYTYDIGNYYQLNDAFTFESSIEELNDYINAR